MAREDLGQLIRENHKEVLAVLTTHETRITRSEEKIVSVEATAKGIAESVNSIFTELKESIDKWRQEDANEKDTVRGDVAKLRSSHDQAMGAIKIVGAIFVVACGLLGLLFTLKLNDATQKAVKESPDIKVLQEKEDSLSKRVDFIEKFVTPSN